MFNTSMMDRGFLLSQLSQRLAAGAVRAEDALLVGFEVRSKSGVVK